MNLGLKGALGVVVLGARVPGVGVRGVAGDDVSVPTGFPDMIFGDELTSPLPGSLPSSSSMSSSS